MRTLTPNKIIFSVYQSNRREIDNHDNHKAMLESLKIPSFEVWGFYKGQPELSIVVTSENYKQHLERLVYVKGIAKQFNQESILEVSSDDSARLHFIKTEEVKPLGTFQEVSKDEAQSKDAYTFEPVNARFFVAK